MTATWLGRAAAAVALCSAALAHAAHPLETEDTATQGAGNVELENGFARSRAADAVQSGYQLQASYGLSATLDLQVQPSWVWQRGGGEPARSGRGDTNVDFKWRFFGEAPWSLALRAGAELATAERDLGLPRGTVSPHATLVATLELEPFAVHANLGSARLPRSSGLRRDIPRGSAAVQWAASDSLTFSAEATAARSDDPASASWERNQLVGVVLTLRPGLDIDFGAQRGAGAGASSRTWLMGLTWRFAP